MLFAARHEPLAEDRFGEASAREEIARIAARAERELDASDGRWPLDPDHDCRCTAGCQKNT
jgi:hypothetical protein